jgi:hypothetical protein
LHTLTDLIKKEKCYAEKETVIKNQKNHIVIIVRQNTRKNSIDGTAIILCGAMLGISYSNAIITPVRYVESNFQNLYL